MVLGVFFDDDGVGIAVLGAREIFRIDYNARHGGRHSVGWGRKGVGKKKGVKTFVRIERESNVGEGFICTWWAP